MPVFFSLHAKHKKKRLLPLNSPLFGVEHERLWGEEQGYQNFEKESNWFWKREVINSTQQNLSSQGLRSCLRQHSHWPLNSLGWNCTGLLLWISFHKYSPTCGFASADSTNCKSTENSIFAFPALVSQLQILNYGWKSLSSIWDWITPPIKRVTVESKSHRGIFNWGGPTPQTPALYKVKATKYVRKPG